ncbi:putative swr1-complex protein 5 [Diaporthe ampelina]|uniref:SWR1-complex protein 5 n=1 Tax=Diaporthe ampelina TaxID=1214573 RepID=A0A0G2IF99_9PEZI|nr:putative swr1-complex protein 5 [Diaporthe ampelina]
MSHEPMIDDEDYASSEDSDFAPEEAPERGDVSSDDEDEAAGDATESAPVKRKRQPRAGDGDGVEDAGFENSGDEAIIGKGKKKQKSSRQAQRDEDEGGEGGLIKTRSMRAIEKAERQTQAASGPVTVDVDALWASMTAEPVVPTKQQLQSTSQGGKGDTSAVPVESGSSNTQAAGKDGDPNEMIKIKRTYNFAGKIHTEEKLVQRDSAEARLYLSSQGDNASAASAEPDQPDKRMPRKAFRSAFEPVAAEQGQRADLNLGMAVRLQARQEKARKLNTVEKSRMDWAGFVDKEGIKDELALAGRAKGAFADRQDFLARSEARRDEEARRVRIASKV